MDNIVSFHNFLLYIITGIVGFVLPLLVIVMVRFNAKTNPAPSRTTHNTWLEWPDDHPDRSPARHRGSLFKLLFFSSYLPADLTVKATGKQWYWSYTYPDSKFEFDP